MTIETRPLGRTGADVTILGYRAMELRGQPRGPAIVGQDAGRLLGTVLDSGIDLIDTRPGGRGRRAAGPGARLEAIDGTPVADVKPVLDQAAER
jgi:hypothetical protein